MVMTLYRPEQPDDIPFIHQLLSGCFPGSKEADLVNALRLANRLSVSLVAEAGGFVVGHVAFSPVTAGKQFDGVGLAPLAVAADHRRRGIGAELVRRGLEKCRAANWRWCVVLGDPEYYGRFGFRPAPEFGLSDEYGGGDAFGVFELVPNSIPTGAGLVRYAPEFAVFTEDT